MYRVTQDQHWVQLNRLQLTENEKRIILDGGWINDVVIHAAELLMKNLRVLPEIGSLQNPTLGQRLQFEVFNHKENVQILHSNGNHWVTVSTVGASPSTVLVYDSLYDSLPWETKEQIASLLYTKNPSFTLKYANVQVRYV